MFQLKSRFSELRQSDNRTRDENLLTALNFENLPKSIFVQMQHTNETLRNVPKATNQRREWVDAGNFANKEKREKIFPSEMRK